MKRLHVLYAKADPACVRERKGGPDSPRTFKIYNKCTACGQK